MGQRCGDPIGIMKFVCRKGLPKWWKGHLKAKGLAHEFDVSVRPRGRLRAKILIFDSQSNLRRFWKEGLGCLDVLEEDCYGVVSSLVCKREKIDAKGFVVSQRLEGDPRFFCVMGFLEKYLSDEVISHEAVHAAFCYERRRRRKLWKGAEGCDEENIAYPAGILSSAIYRYITDAGLSLHAPPKRRIRT